MFDQFILWIFLAATAVQLFFWLFFFARLAFYRVEDEAKLKPEDAPPVTVIVCAHNEAANLRRNLHRILNQNYRCFEVLVVSHNSVDETKNVIQSLQRKHTQLSFLKVNDGQTGKKFALAKGIERANYQVLLLTDADCMPDSDNWISEMVAGMDKNTQIVLGFAPYEKAPSPLNIFIRFEACHVAMQYLSLALAGLPYMGVGRNLAYRRELFFAAGGFSGHEHLASGDDDLFVNRAARLGRVGIRLNPHSFVFSPPKLTWQTYYRQKRRHFSTGKHYRPVHQALLGALALSHALHYLGGFFLLALNFSIIFVLLGYAVRLGVVLILSGFILRKLNSFSLLFWLPVLDAVYVVFYFVFSRSILMNIGTQRWS